MLSEEDKAELSELCGRCLYHTLRNAVRVHGSGERVFVATGDIEDMWLRDSAVQLGIYLPRLSRHPALRRIMDGAIRMAAFYILQVSASMWFPHVTHHLLCSTQRNRTWNPSQGDGFKPVTEMERGGGSERDIGGRQTETEWRGVGQ